MKSFSAALLLTPDNALTSDGDALLRTALMLRARARAGDELRLLSGRHIALLGDEIPSASQCLVEAAAQGLGARVARLSSQAFRDDGPKAEQAWRMLGRLYDVMDCEDLPDALVKRLSLDCGIPVYEGLGCKDHPVADLLPHLAEALPQPDTTLPDDHHRFLLQAVLVCSLL